MFPSLPRPSRLPLPHPLAFISPSRPNERTPGNPCVCVCVCAGKRGSPSETATGVEGQKLSLSGRSPPPNPSFPLLRQPVNTKSGKKAHITSSLRVKDRPPPEWLLRAALSHHRAADYTLCHLCAGLAFLSTQARNIKHQPPLRPANTTQTTCAGNYGTPRECGGRRRALALARGPRGHIAVVALAEASGG